MSAGGGRTGDTISMEPPVPTKASLLFRIVPAIILVGALGAASAQDAARDHGSQAGIAERRAAEKGVLRLLPADSVTEHSINTTRGPLAYTATAWALASSGQTGV